MTHDPDPRPTRADMNTWIDEVSREVAKGHADFDERMNEPRRINWPVAIGVICIGATIAGGMTWAVARALGV